jgi:hypothetical protein
MNLFRSLLAILILFIPLYPKFPLTNFSNTYVALRLDDLIIGLIFFIWLIKQFKSRFPIFKEKITWLFIAYFLAIIASTVTAVLIYQTDPLNILLLHLIRRFEYISLFFITLEAVKTKKDLLYPYVLLLISLTGIAIYGYGQKYLEFPVISTMNEEFSKGQLLQMNIWTRISSTFAGHYDLAAYLSLVLIIILGVFVIYKNLALRLFSLPLFLIGFHLLTLTASRVSIFAFWGGSILSLLLIRKYLWIVPLSILVILSMTQSVDLNKRLLATLPLFKINTTSQKIIPTSTPVPTPTVFILPVNGSIPSIPKPQPTVIRHGPIDEFIPIDTDVGVARSGEIRFNVEWPRAITAFRKNPLNGTGLGSISLATDNDYLRLLGESGLLGLVTFLTPLFFLLLKSFKLIKIKKPDSFILLELTFIGVLFAALANAVFIDIFEASKVAYTFWIFTGIYHQLSKFNQKLQ